MNPRLHLHGLYSRIHTKYLADCIFVHINKTGGTSIERALGLPHQHRTMEWITDARGDLIVDFVGRFERLQDDFAEVVRRLGVSAQLPYLRRSERPRDYRPLYSSEAANVVAQHFRADLEAFGYEYESVSPTPGGK